MDQEDRISKIELLKKLISLKNDLNKYEQSATNERRKMKVDIDRKAEEIKTMVVGNRNDIDKLWYRSDDHNEDLKSLQEIIQWIEKTILGVFITVVLGFIVKTLFGI